MDFSKLWSLFLLSIRHPLFVIPTIRGTRKCVAICDDQFGNAHHRNGTANAFRHALWNMLIVQKSVLSGRDLKEAIAWAKTITDWHEEFSPNTPLARAMDLHNNQIGRNLIALQQEMTTEEMTQQLLEMIPLSRKLSNLQELTNNVGILVHIED